MWHIAEEEAAVRNSLAAYYRAFSQLDLEASLRFFHEPAMIVAPTGVFAAADHATLRQAIAPTMDSLRARGYARSELGVLDLRLLSAGTASVKGIATRYDSGGHELDRVGVSYLLQKSAGTWKIAVLVLHDA